MRVSNDVMGSVETAVGHGFAVLGGKVRKVAGRNVTVRGVPGVVDKVVDVVDGRDVAKWRPVEKGVVLDDVMQGVVGGVVRVDGVVVDDVSVMVVGVNGQK